MDAQQLENSKNDLKKILEERFLKEIMASMVFIMFEDWSEEKSGGRKGVKKKIQDGFIKNWADFAKEQTSKELKSINDKITSPKIEMLVALTKEEGPSTEDYQLVYNAAIKNAKEFFLNHMGKIAAAKKDTDEDETW
jgi:hypothetical protein